VLLLDSKLLVHCGADMFALLTRFRPGTESLLGYEFSGVHAGVRKPTAIHDQLFAQRCQWVLWAFHRFFAGFFGFCPI
jgi:hypothetical protein